MKVVNKLKKIVELKKNREALIGPYRGLTPEERKAAKALQGFSNAELADLGLARGTIREAVRNGRDGIDPAPTHRAA